MYVQIVDRGECFSTTMEFIDGVYANKTEWAKHNFYPQNGMVGKVVKITPRAYIIKISDGIYVPMTKKGIKEITEKEFLAKAKIKTEMIQDWLGHSDMATTANIYSHIDITSKKETAQAIGELLG